MGGREGWNGRGKVGRGKMGMGKGGVKGKGEGRRGRGREKGEGGHVKMKTHHKDCQYCPDYVVEGPNPST